MSQPSRPMIALPVAVPAPTYDGLGRLAKQAGMRRELYAAQLLVAAYSARVKPTGDDPELEAVVAELKNDTASHDDTIRHLIRERDGWKKTAEEARVTLNDARRELDAKKTGLAVLGDRLRAEEEKSASLGRRWDETRAYASMRDRELQDVKATCERLRAERDALQAECEQLQAQNDKLLTDLSSCARPLPPMLTITAKPELSPETYGALQAAAFRGLEALREAPPALVPALPEIEVIPPKPDAPLSPEFISRVVAYRWAGMAVADIAKAYRCPEAKVRQALRVARRRAA